MLGKEKSKYADVPLQVSKTSSKDISTLIGEGCKVEGSFFVPTTTRIDGIIIGDLTGQIGLIIGPKGMVEGNICAAEVIVYGNVKGNIEADKLELKRDSVIEGDLNINYLLTEPGIVFNGSCTMKPEEKEETELISGQAD